MDKITEAERKVVDELRNRTVRDVSSKMLEEDSLFYRFAKARDFIVEDSEVMLKKHIIFRKEWKIDSILTDYKPPEVLLKYGGSSFVCFDKEGCAVRIGDLGRVDGKGLCSAVTKTEMAKFSVYIVELDKASVIRRGGNLRKPIFAPIYDFEDLTYAKATHVKGLQSLLYVVKIILDNYPESVKTVTVINAPVYYAWIYAAFKPILPSTVSQKIRIFGPDGWKEALLKDIHAEDLPAYLGGSKTDPDGNPLCETFIQRGQLVPKKYYKQNREKRVVLAFGAEKITVRPFSNEEISFEVKEKNSYLEWEFEVKKGDIEFSLEFRGETSENLETGELIPKQRIDTSKESEKGCVKCERIGIYTIIFDNSYSWLHSKEIYYKVGIRNAESNKVFTST